MADELALQTYNSGGARTPWVMVQVWPEERGRLQQLAPYVGPDQPLVGISPPPTGVARRLVTAGGYARYVMEQLDHVPVDPPYHLFGWSFGGTIAIEVAYRYRDSVAGVAAIDTWSITGWNPRCFLERAQAACMHRSDIGFARAGRRFVRSERRAQWRIIENQWQYLRESVKSLTRRRGPLTPLEVAMWSSCSVAISYRTHAITTPATYITTLGTIDWQGRDPFIYWKRYFSNHCHHYTISGDHYTLWDPPHVVELAKALESGFRGQMHLGRDQVNDQGSLPAPSLEWLG